MSSAPISDVLSSLGLSQYTERFEQEGFDDWEAAQEMTESDLYERRLISQIRS